MLQKHRTDYEVLSRNADSTGRLSVRAIILMLFDAADRHASQWSLSLGQLAETTQTWVLSRLNLRLDRQPAWKEHISIETWPTGAMRLLAGRDFLILAGESPIGSASTYWLMIDRESRRPVPLPSFVSEIERPDGTPVVRAKSNWPAPVGSTRLSETEVHWNDLDLNRHASAPSYLNWLLSTVPADTADMLQLGELDVLFKNEGFLGDRIRLAVSELNTSDRTREYTHTIVRTDDQVILASARSSWRR